MYRPGFPLSAGQVDVQMSSKASSPGHGSPLPPGTPLCEDGRPYVTDPVTGRKICMCNLGAEAPYSHHSLLPGARKHVGLPVTAGIPTVGFDATAFYSPLIRGMPMRQDRLPPYLTSAMPGQPVTFDPAMSAHPYGLLYAGMDMNGGPIRKAATRETTGPLKAWLSEHKKNPYPTKAEKIMLAIITRMSLTQVSTWFANARRRLKKENKLYPASGNRDDDDDDDDDASDGHRERNKAQSLGSEHNILSDSDNEDINVDLSDCSDVDDDVVSSSAQRAALNLTSPGAGLDIDHSGPSPDTHHQQHLHQHNQHHDLVNKLNRKSQIEGRSVMSVNAKAASSNAASDKPKIWSISEIISGPSPSDSSHKRHHALGHPSLHHNTPSALSYPSSSSTSMRRVSPNSSSVTFASSPLSVSPFSSSSSSSPISPPAFRPIPSIMGASPLFLHRPELSSFVSRYSLPLSTNGLHLDQQTLASIPITHNLETVATASRDASLIPKPLDRTSDHNNSDYSPSKTSNNLVIKPEEDPHPQDSPKDKHYRHKSMSPPLSASETTSRIPTSTAMHSPSHTKANMQRNHTTPSPEKPTSYNSDRPKLSAPYKPKTQNALNGTGTADSEVALDLQTKKRTISDT